MPNDPLHEARQLLAAENLASGSPDRDQVAALAASHARAVGADPGRFDWLARLGSLLMQLGCPAEAATVLSAAATLRPDNGPVLVALTAVLHTLHRRDDALDAGRRAVAASPVDPAAWTNLGAVLQALGRLAESADAYSRALALDPGFALAEYNLAHVRNEQWRADEARAGFRRALELDPGYPWAWSAFLFNLLYDPAQTEETLHAAHLRWGGQLRGASATAGPGRHRAASPQGTRIRVGYVSADFSRHSCGNFLRPLFACHDRSAVEVFAYSSVPRADDYTAWFRQSADHWRQVDEQGDVAVAELIRRDGIDVLVDLGGHTRHHPLGVFALQPAPVQVAWLGYPATTGLSQVQYRLTDAVADPPGDADRYHTERLVRLPGCFLCYQPPENSPPVSMLPAARVGAVTFGSFNNIAKVTPEVVITWAEVLHAVPGSRLLLKGALFRHGEVRERLVSAFADAGIDSSRLALHGWMRRADQPLSLYHEVDVALDTYPYNGATTTFEALWMGVPVVTLRDNRHAGRVGASILSRLGRPAWIATDADAYVDIARQLAADLPALAAERARLRQLLAESTLTDAASFAHGVEDAYRRMLAG